MTSAVACGTGTGVADRVPSDRQVDGVPEVGGVVYRVAGTGGGYRVVGTGPWLPVPGPGYLYLYLVLATCTCT